jgi:septum formation protein
MRRLGEWPFAPGELMVLGADTVVWKESAREVLGQPRDAPDAERILRLLESGEHEVITGVALIDAGTGQRDIFVDRARVRVGALGEERIREYLAGGQWAGKAGAYNLRERLEAGWPIEYSGDPGTIMGLPMEKLVSRLRDFADACSRQAMS